MTGYIKISRYHIGIIVTYLLATPLLWHFMPYIFQYSFNNQNSGKVLGLIVISVMGFGIYLHFFKEKELKINLHSLLTKIPLLILYALFFTIPEELIFRGMIQNYLQTHLTSITMAVALSSFIFGIVHLPNGAQGISPTKWNWQYAIIAALGGLVFGAILALTGSLLISTLLHTFFLFLLIFKATRK